MVHFIVSFNCAIRCCPCHDFFRLARSDRHHPIRAAHIICARVTAMVEYHYDVPIALFGCQGAMFALISQCAKSNAKILFYAVGTYVCPRTVASQFVAPSMFTCRQYGLTVRFALFQFCAAIVASGDECFCSVPELPVRRPFRINAHCFPPFCAVPALASILEIF